MNPEQIYQNAQEAMDRVVVSLKTDFLKIRTGRANPAMLDSIRVDYYGSQTPMNQLGNIAVPDAQLITFTPWEKKVLADVERAILKSNLGLTPQNDGNQIKIPIPPLSEERRKEMVKQTKKITEEHKNSVRNLRREANQDLKKLEKEKSISEDELKKETDKIQKLTDSSMKRVDDLMSKKETELLEF